MTVTLHHGEAVEVLPRYSGQAALIYMDSLFGTGRTFRTRSGEVAFEDRFAPGAFRPYLEELIAGSFEALAPHGALWIHCSVGFQPLAREIADRVFAAAPRGGFEDQVIWNYRRWTVAGRRCNQVHDYLLRYVRDRELARWTQLYQPLAESTRATWGTKKQKAMVRDGVRRRSISTDEESRGAPLGDVWSDIGVIAPSARERTGFPTQKPEKLLSRLVAISSLPGDLVLDPTCGAASMLVAAQRLGRDAVGIDRSEVAIRFARERLAQFENELALSPRRATETAHRRSLAGPRRHFPQKGNVE